MLILTRQRDQKLVIKCGDYQATLTIIEVRSKNVKFGLEGDREIEVYRSEIMKDRE